MGKGGVCWLIPQGRQTDAQMEAAEANLGRGGVFSRELKDDAGTELSGEGRAAVDEGAGNEKNEKRRGRT